MKHLHDCPIITGYQTESGAWSLQLPDPFRRMRWFPLDAVTLADLLDVSRRTAVRICQRKTPLRRCEVIYLQSVVFGLIPDAAFHRARMFVRGGMLYSADYPGLEFSPGALAAWQWERQHYADVRHDLAAARQRITELENLLNPPAPAAPSNVIRFPKR